MKLELLSVTQYRIFQPDTIPFRAIISQLSSDAIKKLFKFRAATINENGEAVFQAGAVGRDGEPPIWIHSLTLNERRIILHVDGTSAEANRVHVHVTEALGAITNDDRDWSPLVIAEETSCVVKLDISWEELFGPGVTAYINGPLLNALAVEGGEPFLRLPSARFSIGYLSSATNQRLGIGLPDKIFAIEPRVDVPLTEQKYYTMSPLGTTAHAEMLKNFERSIISKRKKR